MWKLIAVVVLLAGCDIEEPVENLIEAAPSVQNTPEGPEVFPPGWYLHDYPAYCVMLARDREGQARRCYDYSSTPAARCSPTSSGGCRHFGF